MPERLNIAVAATIASVPEHAGWTWAVMQYVLGFLELGHRVWFVDPIHTSTIRPQGTTLSGSDNAKYFESVIATFEIDRCSTLLLAGGAAETAGRPLEELTRAIGEADVLINVSGALRAPALLSRARRRVYLDVDPVFTQLWAAEGVDMGLDGHSHYVTIGWNIGNGSGSIPSADRKWIPTLQPIVLDRWPSGHAIRCDALTTVANWRGYGSVSYRGTFFGQKAHSLRQFIAVPRRVSEPFVLALAIDPGEVNDLLALEANGWRLIDPVPVSRTPEAYQRFIQGSKAEFGIAKSGYVAARCGWFSDRSICYLASGRPVLAQDTGLEGILPTGEGVIAFTTEDDIVAGVDSMKTGYRRHASAARAIAEEYFDSRRVLTRLLDEVGR